MANGDYLLCSDCDQPILKPGQKREHSDDYRHASGCPADTDQNFTASCPSCYGQDFQPAALRTWQISFAVPAHVYYANSGYVQVTRAAKIAHPYEFDMSDEPKPELYHCNHCGNLFTADQAEMLRLLPPVEPPSDHRQYKPKGNRFLVATKRRVRKH